MPNQSLLTTFAGEFTPDDWAEAFDMSSANTYAISRERANVSLVGNIAFDKLKACVQYLLGYSYTDYTNLSNPQLRRVLPAYHPFFPWLYCTNVSNISAQGLTEDRPTITAPPAYADGKSFSYGKYKRVRITASYEALPWNLYEDSQVTSETQRYCQLKPEPYTEMLVLPNGQLRYDASYNATVNDKPIISPQVRIKQQKNRFDLIWREVPLDFICNNSTVPIKLLQMQKCVNKTAFLGLPIGTLLCEDVKIEQGVLPIATDIAEQNLFQATVTFKLIYFSPPTEVSETKRGWNLWPFQNGLYYPAKADPVGGTGGNYAFEEFNFYDAFTYWNLPLT